MMNREQRMNDKFRRKLQDQWIEEAKASQGPSPVDADQLWKKIDRSIARENLSIVRPAKRPFSDWRAWTMLSAAALALVLVLGGLRNEPAESVVQPVKPANHLDEWNASPQLTHHQEPLQTPSRLEWPRCDQTRQSCLTVAFL